MSQKRSAWINSPAPPLDAPDKRSSTLRTEYVRFERPPVIEAVEPVRLASGEELRAQIKYFDYGVISILFEGSVEGDWPDVIALASAWASSAEFERQAREIARAKIAAHDSALVNVYPECWSRITLSFT